MTLKLLVFIHLLLLIFMAVGCNAQHSPEDFDQVNLINSAGPYLGLVVPNSFELAPLLDPSTFIPSKNVSHIDLSGRRFHVGIIADQKVIVVMTGLAMTYGQGEDDELAWESNGDYTRDIGYIHFANYSTEESCDNLLNNVWFNPDEIFPKNGIPEVREHAFWVNVSETYYNLAEQLQNVTLESCINSTTCLPTTPKIVKVERGCSASILAANAAYKNLLHEKFNCTLIDMESAAVALVSLSMGKPFIIIRALSGLAFSNLASKNAVIALTKFFELLSDKPTNGIEMYDK
ncbi:bark storage protein B isoform X2 [Cryptomeria japonica]|uniref:bark storage protein B isoform X2 n=1 Tax=Cryptomeria japonica TaxID=3369 RepID=UPI0025AB9F6B|nr:bark storage protein B isoform X2 [Cryptomeria japonica]